jgi:hypothetical protein
MPWRISVALTDDGLHTAVEYIRSVDCVLRYEDNGLAIAGVGSEVAIGVEERR